MRTIVGIKNRQIIIASREEEIFSLVLCSRHYNYNWLQVESSTFRKIYHNYFSRDKTDPRTTLFAILSPPPPVCVQENERVVGVVSRSWRGETRQMFRIKVRNAAECEGTKRSIKQSVKREDLAAGGGSRAKTKKIKPLLSPLPSPLLLLSWFQKRVLSVRSGENWRRRSPKLLRLTSLKAAHFSPEIYAVYHSLNTSFYGRFMARLAFYFYTRVLRAR